MKRCTEGQSAARSCAGDKLSRRLTVLLEYWNSPDFRHVITFGPFGKSASSEPENESLVSAGKVLALACRGEEIPTTKSCTP